MTVDMYWTIVHAYYCLACTSYFFFTEQTAFYIMLTLRVYHHVVIFKIQIVQNNSTENKTNNKTHSNKTAYNNNKSIIENRNIP